MSNQFQSPVATVLWPSLFEASVYDPNNPNAKPNPVKGEYGAWQTDLVFNPSIPEHKEFLEMLDAEVEAAVDAAIAAGSVRGHKKPVMISKREELDSETKSPTGAFKVRFKVPAGGISRRTGSHWERKVPMVDAGGKMIELDGEVANGSKARVSFEIRPYSTGGMIGASLRLNAVQFLVLETKTTAGANANPFEGQALSDALTDVEVSDANDNGGDF